MALRNPIMPLRRLMFVRENDGRWEFGEGGIDTFEE